MWCDSNLPKHIYHAQNKYFMLLVICFLCARWHHSVSYSTQWTCRFRFGTNQSDALEGGPSAIAQVSVFCLHSFSGLFIKILCWPCACGVFFLWYMSRYLEEVGYSDTILDMRSKRVRSLLGRNSPEANGPPPSEPPAEPEPCGEGESLLVRQIEEQIKRLEQHAFWHLSIKSAEYSPVGVCVQMKWSLEIVINIKIIYLILLSEITITHSVMKYYKK